MTSIEVLSHCINLPYCLPLHDNFWFFVSRSDITLKKFRLTTTRLGTKLFFLPELCKRLCSTILLYPFTSAMVHLDLSVATSFLTVSKTHIVLEADRLKFLERLTRTGDTLTRRGILRNGGITRQ